MGESRRSDCGDLVAEFAHLAITLSTALVSRDYPRQMVWEQSDKYLAELESPFDWLAKGYRIKIRAPLMRRQVFTLPFLPLQVSDC